MATDANLRALRKRLATASEMEGLDGPIDSLHGVNDFLIDSGFQREELRPLSRLMGALTDHQRGKPHPLLAVVKKPGRRRHIADDMFKCCVAVTVTVLMKAGRGKKQAIKETAETLRSGGIDVSEPSVESYHREISSERVADGGVIQEYQYMLDMATAQDDIEKVASFCLERLPTLQREEL